MMSESRRHYRRSIRLRGYDYAKAGAYFLTICTHNRRILFGDIAEGEMGLNEFGEIADEEWRRTAVIRSNVDLDEFIIMPNHLHAIVLFKGKTDQHANVEAHSRALLHRAPKSLGSLVAGYKSAVTKRINQLRHTPGTPVWQRNYYEHVIRSESDLASIRHYVHYNAMKWPEDRYNPVNSKRVPSRRDILKA